MTSKFVIDLSLIHISPYIYIENDHFTALPDHVTKGTGKGFFREGPTAPGFEQEKVLDELTDKVLEKIEEYREEPFFLYFPMPAPHTPVSYTHLDVYKRQMLSMAEGSHQRILGRLFPVGFRNSSGRLPMVS